MKGRIGLVGRSTAALGIALAMLVAAGTGAGAAARVSLTNYTASAMSRSLGLELSVPALNVNVHEDVSLSTALGQWDKASGKVIGSGTARILDGAPLSLKTTSAAVRKANAPEVSSSDHILAQDVAGIVRIGAGETKSTVSSGIDFAHSVSSSSLASIVVKLDVIDQATGGLVKQLQATLNGNTENPNGGVIDTINQSLASVTGVDNLIEEPQLVGTNVDLLNIQALQGSSETYKGTNTRWAKSENQLLGISALGHFIDISLLKAETKATLNNLTGRAVMSETYARSSVGTVSIGGKLLNLDAKTLTVGGKVFDISQATAAINQLTKLVNSIAGLRIDALENTVDAKTPGHVFTQARTLAITLAPAGLFALKVTAPMSQASVDNGTQKVLGRRLTRTGLADTSFLILGPVLLGAAVMVRRFAISR